MRHAQERLGIAAGESVVVLGQGTTGLLHTRLAVLAGANPVIAVSRSAGSWRWPSAWGRIDVSIAAPKAPWTKSCASPAGAGADVVIDTAGGAATLKAGMDMLRPGGRLLAPYRGGSRVLHRVHAFPLYYKEMSIIGSRALTHADMQPSIDLVASGKIDVSDFVTQDTRSIVQPKRSGSTKRTPGACCGL